MTAEPTAPPRASLFLASAVALLVELALIRWLSSEVRVFAYFKNLVLIASFLGFGLGFYRSARPARLLLSLGVLVGLVAAVQLPASRDWPWGPAIASEALSNFQGTITMNDDSAARLGPGAFVLALAWTTAIFLACQVALFGYAQKIGADMGGFGPERRLEAYSWNVAGSLAGVLAFSFASWIEAPPIAWFAAAVLGTAPLLPDRRSRLLAIGATGLVVALLPPQPGVTWSPYQKLELDRNLGLLRVNGTGYMVLCRIPRSPAEAYGAFSPTGLDRWQLPYRTRPKAESVLVIGAGGGNDVSAALIAGAKRVVAVEIDPAIYEVGRRNHPDHPYDDKRVEVVLDDARHYGEVAREKFDLIVFSHLDAHQSLSSFTNVRLDNYIHTTDSFATFRRLLNPGGVLFVAFFVTQPWVTERLRVNVERAFGAPPVALLHDAGTFVNAHLVATEDPALARAAAALGPGHFKGAPRLETPVEPSTDDWPYLFVRARRVPAPMLWLVVPTALAAVASVLLLTRRTGEPLAIDGHFFFLGAAFLLLEVHNVGRLARVFGTTWSVNAWVVSGVLVMVLVANAVAGRFPRTGGRASYALLVATLLLLALLPLERLLALPGGGVLATTLYTLPLFFAGLIFAASFRATADPWRALGSNVLGSVLGGFLEMASFIVGISGLLWIAAGLYLLSLPRERR